MTLILFGFKRVGKTYFGTRLSTLLQWSFIDTDALIERVYQDRYAKELSCREIALEKGDPFFRELEEEVITSLSPKRETVIALGGGAILRGYEKLKQIGTLTYLEMDKKRVKERILTPPIPSFLDPADVEGAFEKMYEARKSYYETVAMKTVSHHDQEEVVLRQLQELAYEQ